MRRKVLIAAFVLALGVGAVLLLPAFLWPNRAIIQNASGDELRDVRLVLSDFQGGVFLDEQMPRLAPGESIRFRHNRNDLRAELSYTLSGKEQKYEQPYIDLWRGEGYVFAVRPDGTVETR